MYSEAPDTGPWASQEKGISFYACVCVCVHVCVKDRDRTESRASEGSSALPAL